MDVSDYMDNDVVHLSKSVLSGKYGDNAHYISPEQLKFIVISRVATLIKEKNIRFHNINEFLDLLAYEMKKNSLSLDATGLKILSDTVHNRLAVNDMKDSKTDEKELEDG